MPAVRGESILKVSVRGAGRAAADFDRLARRIQDEINAELRAFGIKAERIYRDEAPKDTKQLKDQIRAVPFFRAARPRLRVVVEPLTGHGGDGRDYLAVTRRGHRKERIYPRVGRALKVHTMGHRNPHVYVFRHSVHGVGHGVAEGFESTFAGDWVSRAEPRIRRAEDAMQRRLGRRVERGRV